MKIYVMKVAQLAIILTSLVNAYLGSTFINNHMKKKKNFYSSGDRNLNLNSAPNYCCFENCIECQGPLENECLTCKSGYYYYKKELSCLKLCPTGI